MGRIFGLVMLCWLAACAFEPGPGTPLAMGGECERDGMCQSGYCGVSGSGVCQECRSDASCGAGLRCELSTGQCVGGATTREHAANPGLHRSTNQDGHVHVGRVAVVPVTTEVQR